MEEIGLVTPTPGLLFCTEKNVESCADKYRKVGRHEKMKVWFIRGKCDFKTITLYIIVLVMFTCMIVIQSLIQRDSSFSWVSWIVELCVINGDMRLWHLQCVRTGNMWFDIDMSLECMKLSSKKAVDPQGWTHIGPVMDVPLSCYLVLLTVDSKTR